MKGKTSLSVTELRNALRCPRLFVLGRRGEEVRFPVGTSGLGVVFHRLVHRLAKTAVNPPAHFAALPADASAAEISRELSAWMLSLLVRELEENPALQHRVREVEELADALRNFAAYLSAHFLGEPTSPAPRPATRLAALIAQSELSIEHGFDVAGARVEVRGQIDALFRPSAGAPRVVEYKLTDASTQALDEAQVVLYRHLLRETVGIEAVPVVLRFTPELLVTEVAAADAEARMKERILPVLAQVPAWLAHPESAPATRTAGLCAACPTRDACVSLYSGYHAPRDFPPAPPGARVENSPLPPSEDDAAAEHEAREVARFIGTILRDLAISARVGERPQVGARFIQLDVYAKNRIKQLERAADDVIHRLQAERRIEATFHKEKGERLFRVVRSQARKVELSPLLAKEERFLRKSPGRFVVGEKVDGSALCGDLGDANSAHLLIGGVSGGGKSVLLRSMAVSMVHFHDPEAIQFTLVDPKRVTFGGDMRERLGPFLAHPLVYDVEPALEIIRDLIEEMETRYELLENHAVQNLQELNEVLPPAEQRPRHVVMIDEFADLLSEKATKEEFLAGVARLGAKARAAGIHLVLATQRPSKQVIPGRLSDNLPGRIALMVPDQIASRIILDQGGAELLLGKGDLIAKMGGNAVRAQSPFV